MKEKATIVGWDLPDGVETVVKGFYQSDVLHITDVYEIIDGDCTDLKEAPKTKDRPNDQ